MRDSIFVTVSLKGLNGFGITMCCRVGPEGEGGFRYVSDCTPEKKVQQSRVKPKYVLFNHIKTRQAKTVYASTFLSLVCK